MTSDNLLKFLGNREYLHQVSYQELKSMVVQYPYSLSLRYLLAMKSQQEDNTNLDRNIELLSTYGIDRSHLHRIFSEDPIVLEDLEESIIMGEDFLELKELSTLERDLGEKLVVNEVNNLNFLSEEPQLTASELPIPNGKSNLPPPPPVIETAIAKIEKPEVENTIIDKENPSVVENTPTKIEAPELEIPMLKEAAIIENIVTPKEAFTKDSLETTINQEEHSPPLDAAPPEVEINSPALLEEETLEVITSEKEELPHLEELEESEEEEEEYITLDFEEEISGETTSSNELAPSAAQVADEIIEESGLPSDAVEVNDLYSESPPSIVDDALVEALFEEAEAEALAEPAISDSVTFIENPEVVLVEESKLISEDIIPTEPETDLSNAEEEPIEKEIEAPIPFEVTYSEADPITLESIQEGTDVVLPEEKEVISEEVQEIAPANEVVPEVEENNDQIEEETLENEQIITPIAVSEKETVIEAAAILKKAAPAPAKPTFKFDSLDRLEATFNQSTKKIKPAPKAKFNSWQAQNASIGQFSGANLMPLSNGKGRTIKKKRKVVRKEFEKTVAFAEESLAMDTALVSETLAQLLVKQGQYSKARKMYEQLRLIMPKKSSFFAGEIEKIQNLPDEDS